MNKRERLPGVVQDIADVIGRDRALFLIGMLPRYVRSDRRGGEQVDLYVPHRLTPDHRLVRILGWHDAERLVAAFRGELLKPASCSHLYREFRDQAITRMLLEGMPAEMLQAWFEVSERHMRYVKAAAVNLARGPAANDESAAKPQEARREASNDDAGFKRSTANATQHASR